MGKVISDVVIGWLIGLAIGVILTIFLFKIDFGKKEEFMIFCFSLLASILTFFIGLNIKMKKEDLKSIHDRIDKERIYVDNKFGEMKIEHDKDRQELLFVMHEMSEKMDVQNEKVLDILTKKL
jgi:hypothetical protein